MISDCRIRIISISLENLELQGFLGIFLLENSAQFEKARSTLSVIPKMYGYEHVLAVKNDLNKAEEKLKKVQKMQSGWDAKQNEKCI